MKTKQHLTKGFAIALIVGSAGLIGCGDSEPTADSQVDTREVTKQPEPQAPSLQDSLASVKEQATKLVEQAKQAAPEVMEQVKQETAQVVEQVKQAAPEVIEQAKQQTSEAMEEVKKQSQAVTQSLTKEPEPQANAPAVDGKVAYSTCIGCHGAAGEGGVGPKLAGQASADLIAKMNAYRAGEQVGPMTAMMGPMAASLTDAEIQALADYITTF